jgi:hypothetical protein
MKTVFLSVVAALLIVSCSSQPPPRTDARAIMARATFDPTRCEEIGPSVYSCNSEHGDPGQAEGAREAGTTNDTTLIRGTCNDGFHYAQGQGCVPND